MTSSSTRTAMALARGALLIGAMIAGPALAQEPPPPANVNECTFLRDPTRVRLCIESFQGSVQSPDVAPQPPSPPTAPPPVTPPAEPIQPPQQAPPPRLTPR